MKYFAPLKIKDILAMISLIIVCIGWMFIDQFFLKESVSRFAAFVFLITILLFLQYSINKPVNSWHYSNSLAVILVIFAFLSSFIIHAIIKHDFEQVFLHSLKIWIISAVTPYFSGGIYLLSKK